MARAGRFTKTWLMDKGTWPLFAVTGAAVGLVSFHLARMTVASPDVYVGKDARKALLRDNHEEGKKYYDHSVRMSSIANSPQLFASLNAKFGTEHDTAHLPEDVQGEARRQYFAKK